MYNTAFPKKNFTENTVTLNKESTSFKAYNKLGNQEEKKMNN